MEVLASVHQCRRPRASDTSRKRSRTAPRANARNLPCQDNAAIAESTLERLRVSFHAGFPNSPTTRAQRLVDEICAFERQNAASKPVVSMKAMGAQLVRWRLGADHKNTLPAWTIPVSHWVWVAANIFGKRDPALVGHLSVRDQALLAVLGKSAAKFESLNSIVPTRFAVTHLQMCLPLLERAAHARSLDPSTVSTVVVDQLLSKHKFSSESSHGEVLAVFEEERIDPVTIGVWFLAGTDKVFAHEIDINVADLGSADEVGTCIALCFGGIEQCRERRVAHSMLCSNHLSACPHGTIEEVTSYEGLPFNDLRHIATQTMSDLDLTAFVHSGRPEHVRQEAVLTGSLLRLDRNSRPILALRNTRNIT
jgi:hypothetical protein